VQVHARMQDVADDGSDRRIHWPEILRMLKLARYRGFVHVDYEGVEEPETAVPRAVSYVRGLLHVIERQQLLQAPSPETEQQAASVEPSLARDTALEAEASVAR
jgi:hypothetical protein